MQDLGQRLIAYGFLGAFCLVGPLFLVIAIGVAVDRVVFIHSALRVDGTIIELRPTGTSRTGAGALVPVVRFAADDGRPYAYRLRASSAPFASASSFASATSRAIGAIPQLVQANSRSLGTN